MTKSIIKTPPQSSVQRCLAPLAVIVAALCLPACADTYRVSQGIQKRIISECRLRTVDGDHGAMAACLDERFAEIQAQQTKREDEFREFFTGIVGTGLEVMFNVGAPLAFDALFNDDAANSEPVHDPAEDVSLDGLF